MVCERASKILPGQVIHLAYIYLPADDEEKNPICYGPMHMVLDLNYLSLFT